MAGNYGKKSSDRRNAYKKAGAYVDGSAARWIDDEPDYEPDYESEYETEYEPEYVSYEELGLDDLDEPLFPKKEQKARQKELSSSAIKNRRKAANISAGYVVLLIIACSLIVASSIHYLRLQYDLTKYRKEVSGLESRVNELKAENDAYLSQITSDIDIDAIRQRAIGSLGMKLPEENQVQTYEIEGRSYVRQFQDVP